MRLDIDGDGRRARLRGGWTTEEPAIAFFFGLVATISAASMSFMVWFFVTEVARDGASLLDAVIYLVLPGLPIGWFLRHLWRWSPRRRALFDLDDGRWRVEGAGPRVEGHLEEIGRIVVSANGTLLVGHGDAFVAVGRSPNDHEVRRIGDGLARFLAAARPEPAATESASASRPTEPRADGSEVASDEAGSGEVGSGEAGHGRGVSA